jgi:hypothetical protein
MLISRLVPGALALAAAGAAVAGPTVPLGQPLGLTLGGALGINLGNALGAVLGTQLGAILPWAGSGVLVAGAASLGFGIYLSRRKRQR